MDGFGLDFPVCPVKRVCDFLAAGPNSWGQRQSALHVSEGYRSGCAERDVIGALVPAVDYTEQLRPGRSIAECGHCRRLMAVEGRQSYLASADRLVYHEACHQEHKRAGARNDATLTGPVGAGATSPVLPSCPSWL